MDDDGDADDDKQLAALHDTPKVIKDAIDDENTAIINLAMIRTDSHDLQKFDHEITLALDENSSNTALNSREQLDTSQETLFAQSYQRLESKTSSNNKLMGYCSSSK